VGVANFRPISKNVVFALDNGVLFWYNIDAIGKLISPALGGKI
jgi:hypothetical protein